MNTFLLTISTPDGNVFNAQAEGLFLRGACGDLAVLAGHAPFVMPVKPCELHIDVPEANTRGTDVSISDQEYSVKTFYGKTVGGILNVTNDGAVLITPSFEIEN